MQIFVKYSVIDGNSANSVIINKTATMFLSEMHKVHTIQRIMYGEFNHNECRYVYQLIVL